jgi:hypothetical protein
MSRKMLGSIELLGLKGPFGSGLNPIWGTVIGGGSAGITTMIARRSASTAPHAEAIGLGLGLAVSGAMFAMKSTRHAAIGSALGAFFASGLAWLEKTLLGSGAPVAGMGYPNVRALNGLGIPQARALNGLGVPMISPTVTPVGTIPGVAGNQLAGAGVSAPPVSLLGPTSPQAQHLRGIGGPAVHGLSAAYGATLLGGGR